MMMTNNLIVWNCRGIGARNFAGIVNDLSVSCRSSFVCLLETHAEGTKIDRFVSRLKLDGCSSVDASGHSGGILCLWDSSLWTVSVIHKMDQVIHLQVQWRNDEPWFLSIVYGAPNYSQRRLLWDELLRFHQIVDTSWCLIGDFNSIVHDHERQGGASNFTRRGMNEFHDFIQQGHFIDAGFVGWPFTWQRGSLCERLDRCLVNTDWRLRFPNATIHHLHHLKSDHRPLWLKLVHEPSPNYHRRPFRFVAAWLTHPDFGNLVDSKWQRDSPSWGENICSFTAEIQRWNKEVFGNIFHRKRIVLRRLNGIAAKSTLNPFLYDLQRRLWEEYEALSLQEEILWYQKSWSKWLLFGDKNTRFFHATTVVRRRRSQFQSLLNDTGEWVSDTAQLEMMVTNFYKELFRDSGPYVPFCLSGRFPPLLESQLLTLSLGVSKEDVRQALFGMGGLKAPGPDGLQALFYQSQWDKVGNSLFHLVDGVFRGTVDVASLNQTLIALIPKVDNVTMVKHFRPISLCNVSYKVITKIITNRLKPLMEHLVSPTQVSFVPGRQSRDNIIIMQEVIHSMRSKDGKKGLMAIKIDFEKAYDRLKWSFIADTLSDIGVPESLKSVIMKCISTPSLRILWNGEALESFIPERGVRQGDPISPYLFVLCMERLSHIIEVAVGQRMWKPIRLSRGGPPLSHLAFADDLVLLSEASMDQADIISSCIDLFCESSGQKVNSDKTRIYFSDNVCSQVREQISSSLGFQRTADLGKYLGVPLFHKRENRSTFAPIMDKINQRLSAWKAKSLSMAGRLTLTKSVLAAMPSYVMQSTSLPIAVCQDIDKACRNFLWGDTTESHRIHLLEWKKVCQPIQHGGLGLRQSSIVNKAFMMKVGWDLIMDREALWARVIRSKYKCGNDILPCVQRRQVSSNLWRGVACQLLGGRLIVTLFGGWAMVYILISGIVAGLVILALCEIRRWCQLRPVFIGFVIFLVQTEGGMFKKSVAASLIQSVNVSLLWLLQISLARMQLLGVVVQMVGLLSNLLIVVLSIMAPPMLFLILFGSGKARSVIAFTCGKLPVLFYSQVTCVSGGALLLMRLVLFVVLLMSLYFTFFGIVFMLENCGRSSFHLVMLEISSLLI